jgi:hypothetical protein
MRRFYWRYSRIFGHGDAPIRGRKRLGGLRIDAALSAPAYRTPGAVAGVTAFVEKRRRCSVMRRRLSLDPRALYDVLRCCWSQETGGKWLAANPARGQCSVTALVVQDLLGGDILKTDIDGAWHFYNRIAGRRWDLTISQFDRPIGYDDLPSSRDEALSDTSPKCYELLRRRVRQSRGQVRSS